MNISQIKQILGKFYNGETTLDEERSLEAFFLEERPWEEDLIPLKKQFMVYHEMKTFQPDITGMEQKVADQIKALEEQSLPRVRTLPVTKWLAAASIVLLIGFAGIMGYRLQHDKVKDTYSDPQLAYKEAEKALLFVSQQMNKGMQPLNHINKMNTATRNLKALEKIDESLGMLQLVSIVNSSSNLKK
jgi:hypothetical protein